MVVRVRERPDSAHAFRQACGRATNTCVGTSRPSRPFRSSRPSAIGIESRPATVALARTLANDPQVILADEPTGNLDSETRQQVMKYLNEFHNDGRTIVMVTHDADTAAFAKRMIRLVDGVTQELAMAEAA